MQRLVSWRTLTNKTKLHLYLIYIGAVIRWRDSNTNNYHHSPFQQVHKNKVPNHAHRHVSVLIISCISVLPHCQASLKLFIIYLLSVFYYLAYSLQQAFLASFLQHFLASGLLSLQQAFFASFFALQSFWQSFFTSFLSFFTSFFVPS